MLEEGKRLTALRSSRKKSNTEERQEEEEARSAKRSKEARTKKKGNTKQEGPEKEKKIHFFSYLEMRQSARRRETVPSLEESKEDTFAKSPRELR